MKQSTPTDDDRVKTERIREEERRRQIAIEKELWDRAMQSAQEKEDYERGFGEDRF